MYTHKDPDDMASESGQSSSHEPSSSSSMSDDASISKDCHIIVAPKVQTSVAKQAVSSDSNIYPDRVNVDSSVQSALKTNKSPLLVHFKNCSLDEHHHGIHHYGYHYECRVLTPISGHIPRKNRRILSKFKVTPLQCCHCGWFLIQIF
jgi:hypothetical protein